MVSGHHPTGGVLEVDLPPPGFIRSAGISGDRCSGAGRRQIVLATNRNGGMLRLNATRHDDDDDDLDYTYTIFQSRNKIANKVLWKY